METPMTAGLKWAMDTHQTYSRRPLQPQGGRANAIKGRPGIPLIFASTPRSCGKHNHNECSCHSAILKILSSFVIYAVFLCGHHVNAASTNLQYPWSYPPPSGCSQAGKLPPFPYHRASASSNLMKVFALSYGWNDTVAYHNVCSGVIHGYPYFIRFPPAILSSPSCICYPFAFSGLLRHLLLPILHPMSPFHLWQKD